jgi:hypothetical protein
MFIYTGTAAGSNLEKIKEHGLGIMISPSPSFGVRPTYADVPCALDNGAFQAYTRGYPFLERQFLSTIDECYANRIVLDFIVCPDIVCGGERSLAFSYEWATKRLHTAPHLALVLQDGMTSDMLDREVLSHFTHIFIGGSPDWKWRTLPGWASLCDCFGKHCHVGRCGTLDKLCVCESLGVASVDRTNFVRNGSWGTIEQFQGKNLFTEALT